MIERYRTSCLLQQLDNEPVPGLIFQRPALAEAKRKKFQNELSANLLHLNLDLYSSDEGRKPQASKNLDQFFQNHVCLDSEKAAKLERSTQLQHCCEAGMLKESQTNSFKEVCHHKDTTNFHAFIQRKLIPKPIDTKAVCFGNNNEELAYVRAEQCKLAKAVWLLIHQNHDQLLAQM